MPPSGPGPTAARGGAAVATTGSPGLTPLVSSYPWMIVLAPLIWMTSPSSCSVPTNWTSYIRGRSPVAVTTGPATRWISPVAFAVASFPAVLIAMCRYAPRGIESLVEVDPDRALDLRPQVLLLRLPHGDHDG